MKAGDRVMLTNYSSSVDGKVGTVGTVKRIATGKVENPGNWKSDKGDCWIEFDDGYPSSWWEGKYLTKI